MDAQNCQYFAFFKLYTRFKDKVEANFEGTAANDPLLFITLTFNTILTNYSTWTTNWNSLTLVEILSMYQPAAVSSKKKSLNF